MSWKESLSDWLAGSLRYWALYLITFILAVCVAVLVLRPVVTVDPEKIAEAVFIKLKAEGLLTAKAFDQRMKKLEGAVDSIPSKMLERIKAEGYLTERAFLERLAQLEADLEDTLDEVPPRVQEWIGAQGYLTERAFLRHIQGASLAQKVPEGDKPTPPVMPSPETLPQLPLLFENAKLAPRQSLDEDWRLSPDSKGVTLTPAHKTALDTFIKAFTPCAAVEGRTVGVRVEGYASSRQFVDQDGRPLPDTDALNLQAANLRAQGVAEYLRNAGQGFEIDYEPWASFGAMRRPFVDRSKALQGTEQEALNRSVVVQVHDAGGCR